MFARIPCTYNVFMPSLETALRLAIIGQEILIAAVFLFGRGNFGARASGALFLLSVSAYLLVSDPLLRDAFSALIPIATLLALIVPHCLWLFARAVFEAHWPSKRLMAPFVVLALGVWVLILSQGISMMEMSSPAFNITRVASLIIVGHALYMAATGKPDDLIEKRRRFRAVFIFIVAIQIAVVLAVELALGDFPPGWLDTLNVIAIAILTLGLSIPLLRLSPAFFAPVTPPDGSDTAEPDSQISARDRILEQDLLAAMADGAYRQTGLTISMLAEQLGQPEHRLRKLINGHLGFRNFSAFLNSYRIPEAREALANPDQVRTPVLTIALDLGYGSLGPFNRAFKAETGMTPTQYRQDALGSKVADSE